MSRAIFLSWSFVALASTFLVADDPPKTTPERIYRAILDDYEADKRAFAALEANTPKERVESLRPQYPLPEKYYARMLALAEAHPGDPSAVDALGWIVATSTNGYDAFKERGPKIQRAMEILLSEHVNDPKVGRVCLWLVSAGAAPLRDDFLHNVYARSTDRRVKGPACLALGEFLLAKSETVAWLRGPLGARSMEQVKAEVSHRLPYLEKIRLEDPKDLARQGEALLIRVIEEFGDLDHDPIFSAKPGKSLADVAKADLRRLHALAIGQEAPEIVGIDVNDRPLKLSDYRGKVVVLVFWGSWCGPCMAEVPHERELAERLKGRPFALLGVDCEVDRDAGIKTMKKERIDWPNWYDGAPGEGPIAGLYQIQGFPAIFVIDPKGVIREKDVRGESMDQVVDGLLKEAERP